jgi:hypothetical protein
MKYVKMLGLLAVAAAAFMGFAGSASATAVTVNGAIATPKIEAETVVGATATLHNAVGTISCDSKTVGTVATHSASTTAVGAISTLTFTNCTGGSVHVTDAEGHVATPGSLEVHTSETTPTKNGTLTSTGAKVTVTMLGVECGYTTKETDIGEVVGGEHAVLKIKATIPRTHGGGGIFCGTTGNWTGEYKVTNPTNLTIH